MSLLPYSFYREQNVQTVARELLGKVLVTCFGGQVTSGIITETEAYEGETDKAAHPYGGRRTDRTEVIYGPGGFAYVYLCYGIHHMFNVVCGPKELPHAVLVRAVEPLDGTSTILKRRGRKTLAKDLSNGPGKVGQALAIHKRHTGTDLRGDRIWIEDRKILVNDDQVTVGPRIGVDYAEEDAALPYRYLVSRKLDLERSIALQI